MSTPFDGRLTVSTSEAGKLLGVGTPRVRQLILEGKLKANKPFGMRKHYILLDDLKAFLSTKSSAA